MKRILSRSSVALPIVFVCTVLATLGCRNRKNVAEHMLGDPARSMSAARCGGSGQIVRPLIVEWPATDRASLEGRLRRGPIVVRYEGCVVEVLRECEAPADAGGYEYLGITRKNDQISIRTSDELYANMPLTAVELEAKLATAGELNVAMALVGNYEATRARFDITELQGRCAGATHVVAAAQVGAFEFYTGAAAEIGAGVEVEGVAGVGGRSTAAREVLNRDGDPAACSTSTPSDTTPPAECGALLRLELSAIDGVATTCQPGSVWNGSACVTTARAETEVKQQKADAKAAKQSENEQVAWQLCEIVMACQAEESGVLPPEGDAYQRQMRTCTGMYKIGINDYTRPQARHCIELASSEGCGSFAACIMPPDTDAGFDDPGFDDSMSDDEAVEPAW